jgi:heterotetrameric sarcosine oxidase delta subunit
MSFLVGCPNCGARGAYEFRFGGEYRRRPKPEASNDEWVEYVYNRANLDGVQKEWWYHRDGCGRWFVAERDTTTNLVKATYWPDESSNV